MTNLPPWTPGVPLNPTGQAATDPGAILAIERQVADTIALAEDLRDVSMCSKTLVVPRPLEDLIGVCEELFGVLRWWNAVRRGDRTIAHGPPGGPPSAYGPE